MPARSRVLASAAVVAAAAVLPGCFVTRAVGLGPDPDPADPQKGDSPQVLYDKAKALYREQRWRDAGEAFGRVWREHPQSPLAADARFYEAEARYGLEKWSGAFELYKDFLKQHPLSTYAALIERRLYDMGTYLLVEGRKGFFDTSGEGAEMLEHLVEAFPNGELADDALIHVAQHAMDHHRPADAVQRLHDLIDRYPGSEWAYEARLRLARAYRELNRGSRYDADALRRAAAQYRAYVDLVAADRARAAEYAAPLEAARSELREVEETLGRKGIEESDFYLAQGKVDAARASLRNVVRFWPDTQAAAEARRRLGEDSGEPK